MSTTTAAPDLANLDVGDLDLWRDGPPHEVFERFAGGAAALQRARRLRARGGFWSVVRFDDIAAVGRDHETFSSKRSIILVDKLGRLPARRIRWISRST